MLARLAPYTQLLASLLLSLASLPASAQAMASSWYVSAGLGGLTPDKPWGAKGAAPLIGLDVGEILTPVWSGELDLSDARLDDRSGGNHSSLEGAALQGLRRFRAGARLTPYLSLGAGATHETPGAGSRLESRTEFMVQPGLGALIRVKDVGRGGSGHLALRADVKVRWTHGWAHAPGNPVDPLYTLGLSYFFPAAAR